MKRSSRSGRDAPKATVSIGSSRPRGSTGDRPRCCAPICRYLLQTGMPVQPAVHGVRARASPRNRRDASPGLFEARFDPALPRATRKSQRQGAQPRHRRRARQGHEPGRRPHPARVPRGDPRGAAYESLPGGRRAVRPKPYLSIKLDPHALPDLPKPRPMFEDLGLLAARRGRAPAHGHGRARRVALVGPTRGLPHRDPRADEGAERQEHA